MSITKTKYLLDYIESTGVFIWKNRQKYSKIKIGDIAGTRHHSGYLHVKVDGKKYQLHRLAWYFTHGYLPEFIDHINHNRADNRIDNLREVSREENAKNHTRRKDNTSGFTGINWSKNDNEWIVRIQSSNKRINIGRFKDLDKAVVALKDARIKYGFHKNHGKDHE